MVTIEQRRKPVAEKKKKTRRKEPTTEMAYLMAMDYFPSMLLQHDFEEFAYTTRYSIQDYVTMDRGSPRDAQFIKKVHATPIPWQGDFEGNREALTEFFQEVEEQQGDGSSLFVIDHFKTQTGEALVVFKMHQKYFPSPARVVVMHEEKAQRTHGFFTTENMLPSIERQGLAQFL